MMQPIPILLYHHVCRERLPYSSTPELFDQHLGWLKSQGYRTITLTQLRQRIEGSAPETDGREVVITFDDGYAELGTDVANGLRRHGFTAAAFLITSRNPESDGSTTDGSTAYLSWEQARALADEGLMDFHTHTHNHERWPLTAAQASVLAEEISTSRDLLSTHLSRPAATFDHLAWPFGRACEAWEDEARALGLPVQYVVQRGAVTKEGQTDRLPRLLVDGMSLRAFQGWVSLLSRRPGAAVANRVFGMIRQRREGAAYV